MRMDIFEGLTQDAKRKAVNEFMQGAVMWNINDFEYIDIVKMKEWK